MIGYVQSFLSYLIPGPPLLLQNISASSYPEALRAASLNNEFLLVHVASPVHDLQAAFDSNVTASPAFVSFLTENHVRFWATSISTTEGYSLANVLSATSFPFLGLVLPQGPRVLLRIACTNSLAEILSSLQSALDQHSHVLMQRRQEQQARSDERQIREMQDEAYQKSLEADKEKQRKVQLEMEQELIDEQDRSRKEQVKSEELQEKKNRRRRLKDAFPAEPEASEATTTLSIKFPTGKRAVRRFLCDDTISVIYGFLDTLAGENNGFGVVEEKAYVLVLPFPRKELTEPSFRIGEFVGKNAALVVEEADE